MPTKKEGELTMAEGFDLVIELLDGNDEVEVAYDDEHGRGLMNLLRDFRPRRTLMKEHQIFVEFDSETKRLRLFRAESDDAGQGGSAARSNIRVDRTKHTYVPPPFASSVLAIVRDAKPHNLWFWGPTGCGKTVFVQWLGHELERKVFRVNCRRDMDSATFLGDRTIDYQEGEDGSVASVIKFQVGQVVRAMEEGLDEDGNEVGPPGILYVDEASAAPEEVAILLNRLLENDDPKRIVVLDDDGGREVVSHSGFRVIFSANTQGRGASTTNEGLYTAQMSALDISLLNRITAYFRFGYHKKAEEAILREKIGNDRVVDQVVKFRDAIRAHIKQENLSTPLSTRDLVNIGDLYRILGSIGEAVYRSLFEAIMAEEVPTYNEEAHNHFGVDLLGEFKKDADFDYM